VLRSGEALAPAARRGRLTTLWLGEWKERGQRLLLTGTTPSSTPATRSSGGALAASEAGRTARCGVAQVGNAKALNDLDQALCDTRCLTFEMRGGARLAG
jgi:hypothetical protein